jgi:predicted DNA-binding transcriptional regulator AlpA
VAALLSVSTRTVYRMVTTGHLPRPIRLSDRTLRWRRDDIEARLAGRNTIAGKSDIPEMANAASRLVQAASERNRRAELRSDGSEHATAKRQLKNGHSTEGGPSCTAY